LVKEKAYNVSYVLVIMYKRTFKANRPPVRGNTNMIPRWDSIKEIIENSNVILEVLDARMPELSREKEIEKRVLENKFNEKKLIFILNKVDLVSEWQLNKNFKKLKKEGECFIFSSKNKIGTKRLRNYLLALGKDQEYLRIGIVGYPNTGKSSIINSLVLKKKVQVSASAGTTHGPQWVNGPGNLSIIDSPGVIPLDEHDEVRLALIAAKNVEKIKNLEIVAIEIIKLFEGNQKLKEFYKIEKEVDNSEELFNEIGIKKGFMKKGGIVDEGRVAIQIIRDWQKGDLKL